MKQENTTNVSRYPSQIKSIQKKNSAGFLTLGIDALMFLPPEGECPLEMHGVFSRFKLTILNKNDRGVSSVYCNIPAEEVFVMKALTDAAVAELISKPQTVQMPTTNSNEASSPAYTQKIGNGTFKGKTPAQILIENPKNKTGLENQRKWLNDNISRYPNNKLQIIAIDDALRLLAEGKLNVENQTSVMQENISQPIDIYRADILIPQAKKVDANGNTFVYTANIACDPSRKYPFVVNIVNMMAKPTIDNNGLVNANLKDAVDKKNFSISLSTAEWVKTINRMVNTVNNFETVNFQKQFKISQEHSYKHE